MNWNKFYRLKALNLAAIGYSPLPLQIPIHLSRNRVILISGGEGSGKSFVTAAEIVARYGLWRLVYVVGPKYEAAHKELDYLFEALLKIGATRKDLYQRPSRGKIVLATVDGAKVETLSAEDGAKAITGTGESPDILAMVEAGKQSYEIFLAARGRIARSRGTLILSGTIEQSERWYPELVTRWQGDNPEGGRSFIVPTWANTVLYPGGRDDPEIKALEQTYPHDQFLERFGAIPVPPSALVYKEFSFPTHVHDAITYHPAYPVEAWIDPGYSGSFYSVGFTQLIPRAVTRERLPFLPDVPVTDVWYIDELYMQYAIHEEVIAEAVKKPFWSAVRGIVGDVVMKTHPMAGQAPAIVWMNKTGLTVRGQLISVQDGIDRHRTFLKDPASGSPRIFFNPQCKGATGEYGRWQRKELGENLYGDPEKINCDALKAIHYGLIDHFGHVDPKQNGKAERWDSLRAQLHAMHATPSDGRWMGERPPLGAG